MTGKMPKMQQNSFAAEWFDFEREEKTMDAKTSAAIKRAKERGFVVEAVEVIPGTKGYQLKSPEGEYIQFGGSEESVWHNAFNSGLLPDAQNEES